jgi:hypothetical protein
MTSPVLLLHGHGRTAASMALFALALRLRGHAVLAPSYGFRRSLADLLDRLGLAAPLLGPVSPHLCTRRAPALEALLGDPADYGPGIIAGSRAGGPVPPGLVFTGPNDGKVTVAATHLAGEADYLVFPVTHPQMLVDGRVRAQTLHFLAHGRFRR